MTHTHHKQPARWLINAFNSIMRRWESPTARKILSFIILVIFSLSLALIILKREGFIGFSFIPDNPFKAIELSFTLLLFFEVISLVFSLEKSVSKSMEVQLEILSLILLRSAFKEFGDFPANFSWGTIEKDVLFMFANAFGALLIFLVIILIRKYEKRLPICQSLDLMRSFIAIKKIIALILLLIFLGLIVTDVINFFMQEHTFSFFHQFYTILIFSDVFLVFVSLRYSNSYLVLFRNSGYALATVIIRLALGAPTPYNIVIGLTASVFVLGLVATYNKVYKLYNKDGTFEESNQEVK